MRKIILMLGASLLLAVAACKKKDNNKPIPHPSTGSVCNIVTETDSVTLNKTTMAITWLDGKIKTVINQGVKRTFYYKDNTIIVVATNNNNPQDLNIIEADTVKLNSSGLIASIYKYKNSLGSDEQHIMVYDAYNQLAKDIRLSYNGVVLDSIVYQWSNGDMVTKTQYQIYFTNYTYDTTHLATYGDVGAFSEMTNYGALSIKNKHALQSFTQTANGTNGASEHYSYTYNGNIVTDILFQVQVDSTAEFAQMTHYEYTCE